MCRPLTIFFTCGHFFDIQEYHEYTDTDGSLREIRYARGPECQRIEIPNTSVSLLVGGRPFFTRFPSFIRTGEPTEEVYHACDNWLDYESNGYRWSRREDMAQCRLERKQESSTTSKATVVPVKKTSDEIDIWQPGCGRCQYIHLSRHMRMSGNVPWTEYCEACAELFINKHVTGLRHWYHGPLKEPKERASSGPRTARNDKPTKPPISQKSGSKEPPRMREKQDDSRPGSSRRHHGDSRKKQGSGEAPKLSIERRAGKGKNMQNVLVLNKKKHN